MKSKISRVAGEGEGRTSISTAGYDEDFNQQSQSDKHSTMSRQGSTSFPISVSGHNFVHDDKDFVQEIQSDKDSALSCQTLGRTSFFTTLVAELDLIGEDKDFIQGSQLVKSSAVSRQALKQPTFFPASIAELDLGSGDKDFIQGSQLVKSSAVSPYLQDNLPPFRHRQLNLTLEVETKTSFKTVS